MIDDKIKDISARILSEVRAFNLHVDKDLENRLVTFIAQLIASGDVFVMRGPSNVVKTENDYNSPQDSKFELTASNLVVYEPYRKSRDLEALLKTQDECIEQTFKENELLKRDLRSLQEGAEEHCKKFRQVTKWWTDRECREAGGN